MSNRHAGSTNGHHNRVCGDQHPNDPDWVCSLSRGHRGNEHKGYRDHQTTLRGYHKRSWTGPVSKKDSHRTTTQDDVAAAMASIQATMQSRLPPQVVADRIAETNLALAEKFDGTNVSVQIHVQSDMRNELDAVIERLTTLRDSLT